MPVSDYNKFPAFVQHLCEGKHNFSASSGGTYKVMLTNTALVPGNSTYSDISNNELAGGNGYVTGGATLTINSEGQVSGTEKVVVSAGDPTWMATGNMGPFRYAVIYRADDVTKGLVAWLEYPESITLRSGETFTVEFDGADGLFQMT
jgi:hypothetical protein